MRFLILLFLFVFTGSAASANKPDLSMFDVSSRADIELECLSIKSKDGIIPFYKCLEKNKSKILVYGGKPDLSMFDVSTRADIELECLTIKSKDGIIPYFDCLVEEVQKIQEYLSPKQQDLFASHICNLEQPIKFLRDKAEEFYAQKKYEDTFTCSLAGAYLDDPFFTGNLGWHYQFGIGVNINLKEANKWYEKGIELDDNYSKINLAKNLEQGNGISVDKERSFQLIKEVAETGDAYAEADLAFYYLQGIGTIANYDESFKYFKLAAEKNNVFAQGYLGWMYAGGRGTELDYDLGFYWTKKAADKADVFAQANLGWHYQNGFGVTMNTSDAIRYYELAAGQKNEFAIEKLKEIKEYEQESKVQPIISYRCNKIKNEKNISSSSYKETPKIIDITYDPSINKLIKYYWDNQSVINDYNTIEFSSMSKILEIWERDAEWSDKEKYFFEMYGDLIAHLYKPYIPGIDYQCKVANENEKILAKDNAEFIEEVKTDKLKKVKVDLENLKIEPVEQEYIAINNTYIRSEPTTKSNKLGKIDKESIVYVIEKINDWYKIETEEGKIGFIFHKLLTPTSSLELIPDNNQGRIVSGNAFEDFGNYYALVIGNNKYENWSELDTAVNDAREIAQILKVKYNFKVTKLFDKGFEDIQDAIYDMRVDLTENDNLLIFFAGHGELDKEANRGYWIPIDGDLERPTKWISNQYIIDQLKASKAKHVMVIADSCFAASLKRGKNDKNSLSNSLIQLSKMKTRVILTSGGLGPVLDGGGEDNHSVFASILIKSLQNKESAFVMGEIFPQIRKYVQNNVEAELICNNEGVCEPEYQTPEFSDLRNTGDEGGDFIFVPN